EAILRIEVVAGLGDREGDDASRWVGADGDQTSQTGFVRNDRFDRGDLGVAALSIGRDGFESVGTALSHKTCDQLRHVRPGIASRQYPARVAGFPEPMQVTGLMRAMEKAKAQMQHHERGRHCRSSRMRSTRRRRYDLAF